MSAGTSLRLSFLTHKLVTLWRDKQGQASHGTGQPGFFLGGRELPGTRSWLWQIKVIEGERVPRRAPMSVAGLLLKKEGHLILYCGIKKDTHMPRTKLVPNCTFLP